MTSAKDYYEILGVPPDATTTEIREAFYRGAKELHPDVNPSPLAKAEFEALQEAFKVLKNPRDRDRYDSSVHSKRVQRGKKVLLSGICIDYLYLKSRYIGELFIRIGYNRVSVH